MTNIEARLRDPDVELGRYDRLEAADAIEALQCENERLTREHERLMRENERLEERIVAYQAFRREIVRLKNGLWEKQDGEAA